jgi:hypothetical protein
MASNVQQGFLRLPGQAAAVQMVVTGRRYVADFTGHIAIAFDPDALSRYRQGATNPVELLIEEVVFNGVGAVIGAISWVKHPDRQPPPSSLRAITPGTAFPAVQDMIIDVVVEIPTVLPGIRLQPVIPTNPGPPILRNSMVTNFPPSNDVYQLVEPMDLEDINNPGPVLATIQNFPVTVNSTSD